MDLWFIFAIIILLIGVPLWFLTRKRTSGDKPMRDSYDAGHYGDQEYKLALRTWREADGGVIVGKIAGRVVLGLGVVLLVMSCWVQVPTNQVGIFTSFGKPVDARPNGFQLKAPWEKVVKFDASRQYLKFGGKGNGKDADEDGKEFSCVTVKMEREAKACVNVVIGWQLRAGSEAERKQTIELYRAHKTFKRLTENFMAANSRSATQAVYDRINPLVAEQNPTFADLSKKLEAEIKRLVGTEVTIISAQVTAVDYDDTTQSRIDSMQAEYAKTEQAKQQEQTNKAISAANAALVKDNSLNDLILRDNCIKGAVANGQNPGVCLQPGWGMVPPQPAAK